MSRLTVLPHKYRGHDISEVPKKRPDGTPGISCLATMIGREGVVISESIICLKDQSTDRAS